MHEHFSSWFRTASAQADLDPELLARRWSGVKAVSDSVEIDDICQLVKKSFGFTATEEFNENFLSQLVEADAAFPTQENEHLLAVLAGSVIADVVDEKGEYSEYAATCVCSCDFGGRRECKTAGLPEISSAFLKARSAQRFASKSPTMFNKFPFGESSIDALKALTTPPEITASIAKSLSALSAKTAQIAAWAESATNQTMIQQEELNVLWWLQGECSRDLSVHFSDIGTLKSYFVVAKELADLVTLLPGPISAPAFLKKALSMSGDEGKKDITLFKAVNQTDVDWKSNLFSSFSSSPSPEITPCLYAASESVDSQTKTAWAAPFKVSSGLDAKGKMYGYDLCQQVFRELLTFRYYDDLSGADA